MQIDQKIILSEDQAFTTVGTTDGTDVLNMGSGYDAFGAAAAADPSALGRMWLNIFVTEAVTSDGAATVAFKLQDSADGSSWADTALSVAAIGKASLTAGTKVLQVPLPAGLRQYLKVVYTVGTAALTAGKFSAFLSNTPDIG